MRIVVARQVRFISPDVDRREYEKNKKEYMLDHAEVNTVDDLKNLDVLLSENGRYSPISCSSGSCTIHTVQWADVNKTRGTVDIEYTPLKYITLNNARYFVAKTPFVVTDTDIKVQEGAPASEKAKTEQYHVGYNYDVGAGRCRVSETIKGKLDVACSPDPEIREYGVRALEKNGFSHEKAVKRVDDTVSYAVKTIAEEFQV